MLAVLILREEVVGLGGDLRERQRRTEIEVRIAV